MPQDIVAAELFADAVSQAHVAAEQFCDGGAIVAVPDAQAIVEPGQIRIPWNKGLIEPRGVIQLEMPTRIKNNNVRI